METLQRTANRGSVATGYNITNSVKLEPDNNEWFYNASPTAGNRQTYTISFWIKRSGLGTVNASGQQYVIGQGQHGRMFFTNDYFTFRFDDGHDCRNVSRQFRDPAAWYHFVVAVDTTQATASNRVKLYVNGDTLEVDDHDGGSFPDQTDQGEFLSTDYLTVGTAPFGGSYNAGDGDYDMRGYLAEFCVIDGQQLTPTSFGEYDDNGIWIAKDVSGLTFGSQGFYLTFETASDMGDDKSGNGNDLTENNLTSADQSTDTPTNNFATLNTLHRIPDTTRKEGNTATVKNNNGWRTILSTLGVFSGKWYFEMSAGSEYTMVGVAGDEVFGSGTTNENYIGGETGSIGYYGNTATFYQDGTDKSPTNVSGFVGDDIVGFAFDADNKKIYFHKNGTYQNLANPSTSSNGYDVTGNAPFFLGFATYQQTDQCEANFGGYHVYSISSGNSDANGYGNFEYAVPSGYYALCTKNLAEYG